MSIETALMHIAYCSSSPSPVRSISSYHQSFALGLQVLLEIATNPSGSNLEEWWSPSRRLTYVTVLSVFSVCSPDGSPCALTVVLTVCTTHCVGKTHTSPSSFIPTRVSASFGWSQIFWLLDALWGSMFELQGTWMYLQFTQFLWIISEWCMANQSSGRHLVGIVLVSIGWRN